MVGIKNESANSDDVISGEGVSSILLITSSPEASPRNLSRSRPAFRRADVAPVVSTLHLPYRPVV